MRDLLPAAARSIISHVPSATLAQVVKTALAVQAAGFQATPHIVARRINYPETLRTALAELVAHGVEQVLLVAGDTEHAAGEYRKHAGCLRFRTAREVRHQENWRCRISGRTKGSSDTSHALERAQGKTGICGPHRLGMFIVTQFGFNGNALRDWEPELARIDVRLPILAGIAGPAPLSKLIKFAMRCGIGASLRTVMRNLSAVSGIAELATTPEQHVMRLVQLPSSTRVVAPHFFCFGGVIETARMDQSNIFRAFCHRRRGNEISGRGIVPGRLMINWRARTFGNQEACMTINLSGRVAVVTGAGGGLGREHALLLARRGAKVVVNDVGGSVGGTGASTAAADAVVAEIRAAGGQAVANACSVTDFGAVQAMIDEARAQWGKVDILINNAGILRDKSFSKMSLEDFRSVIEVHLMGSVHCTKAVWDHMKEKSYGRIVMTTSSSGLYGNFGQANYGAAKLALVGLMQTLALEGAKYNIRVNCIAPSAGTRMLDGLMSADVMRLLPAAAVSPGVLALVSDEAPSRTILCAGGGSYEQAHITLTQGIYAGADDHAAERVAENWPAIADRTAEDVPAAGIAQSQLELQKFKGSVTH